MPSSLSATPATKDATGVIEDTVISTGIQATTQALPPKEQKAVQTIQQAAGYAGEATNLLNNMSGIHPPSPAGSQLPFDMLDTATATHIAKANMNEGSEEYQHIPGDVATTKIAARVSVGGTAVNALSIEMQQALGEHNSIKMTFRQEDIQAEGTMAFNGAELLLGKVAEVELFDENGVSSDKLQHLFVITDIDFDQHAQNEGNIILIGYAPTYLLDGQPHFETFYKKGLKDIVKSVAEPSLQQVKATLSVDPTITEQIPFVCRYNENVWNFLKRLSAETGQWLYFNGSSLIFGKPEAKKGPKIVYGNNCGQIKMSLRTRPVAQTVFDYEAENNASLNKSANSDNSNAGGYNDIAFKKSKELFGTVPAVNNPNFLPAKQSILEVVSKARSAQNVSDMYQVSGESVLHALRLGHNTDVDLRRGGQTVNHIGIRISRITHHWDVTGNYHNSFEGITAMANTPPPVGYQKPVTHPMLAQVIDNNDNKGRIRVKFMGWQQKDGIPETDFIRVLTPDAGGGSEKVATNRGLVTVPEVGDQVYVDFENGNPDRPFVTGSVFHGKVGIGGGTSNNIRSLTTRGNTAVILNEADNSAMLKDPSGNIVKLNGDGTITITAPNAVTINTKDFTVNAGNSITLNALPGPKGGGAGTFELTAKKTISATAQEEDITVKAIAKNIVLDAPAKDVQLKAPAGKFDVNVQSVSIVATTTASFTSTASTDIKGKPINLNQG